MPAIVAGLLPAAVVGAVRRGRRPPDPAGAAARIAALLAPRGQV